MGSAGNDELLTIGEFAARTRMSVSALRFYADAGVFVPADVDPRSGYRRYGVDQVAGAAILRELRAAGMPLADAARILALPTHEAQTEIAAWRAQVDAAHAESMAAIHRLGHLLYERNAMTSHVELASSAWREAVRQVLPASGKDRKRPVLQGVLIDARQDSLRLVSTDSYRLAIRDVVPTQMSGTPEKIVVHANDLTDQTYASGKAGEGVTLEVSPTSLRINGGEPLQPVAGTYPDYEQLLGEEDPDPLAVNRSALLTAVAEFALDDAMLLKLAPDALELGPIRDEAGGKRVSVAARHKGAPIEAAVNPRFLLDALEALTGPDVLIDIAEPLKPLRLRTADSGAFTTLIMPVRVA